MQSIFGPSKAKQAAKAHWDDVRGGVKLQLAESQFRGGQLEDAARTVSEAMTLEPASISAALLLARIRLEQGELSAARTAVAVAAKHAPDDSDVLYVQGMIAEREEQWPVALEFYTRASQAAPDDPDILAARAEALMAMGKAVEALDCIDGRRVQFDDNPRLRRLAAEIYRTLGMDNAAADRMRRAARLAGKDEHLQEELGLTLAAAGRDVEAVGVLESVRALRPRNGPLAHTRADGPEAQTPRASLAAFEDEGSAGLDPSLLRACSTDLLLARSYYRLGKLPEARRILRDVLHSRPDDAAAWLLMARVAIDSEDWATAGDAADQAARLARDRAETHLLRAYVHYRTKDYDTAIDAAQAAIARNLNDASGHCLLGQIYEAQGDVRRARDAYVAALKIDPDNTLARALLRAVEKPITPTAPASDDKPVRSARTGNAGIRPPAEVAIR